MKFNKVFNILTNNKEIKDEHYYFILIDYSDEAYDKAVAHDSLKKMYHIEDGKIVYVEDYTKPLENMYRRNHVVIIDVTGGQEFPRLHGYRNINREVLGRLSLEVG